MPGGSPPWSCDGCCPRQDLVFILATAGREAGIDVIENQCARRSMGFQGVPEFLIPGEVVKVGRFRNFCDMVPN